RHALRESRPVVVVASVRSAVQRLSPSPVAPVTVAREDSLDFETLVRELATAGYQRTDRVEARGEMAVRGGIVDVFPAQGSHPVRIDFWGDHVEDVRSFSVATQRSEDAVGAMVAYPARELRPDEALASRAASLLRTEPWAAHAWERISEGLAFAGIESWLPWLTDAQTLVDELDPGAHLVVTDPARAYDRSRDLVKEEADLAAA